MNLFVITVYEYPLQVLTDKAVANRRAKVNRTKLLPYKVRNVSTVPEKPEGDCWYVITKGDSKVIYAEEERAILLTELEPESQLSYVVRS